MDADVSGEQRLQHLSVLGLDDGASESDIRRSYRTLSVRWCVSLSLPAPYPPQTMKRMCSRSTRRGKELIWRFKQWCFAANELQASRSLPELRRELPAAFPRNCGGL